MNNSQDEFLSNDRLQSETSALRDIPVPPMPEDLLANIILLPNQSAGIGEPGNRSGAGHLRRHFWLGVTGIAAAVAGICLYVVFHRLPYRTQLYPGDYSVAKPSDETQIQDANARREADEKLTSLQSKLTEDENKIAYLNRFLAATQNISLESAHVVSATTEQSRADAAQLRAQQDTIRENAATIAALKKQTEIDTLRLAALQARANERLFASPQGKIQSAESDGTVVINIGRAAHVVPGMTFAVYDRANGIPPLRDGLHDDGLPASVASVEVQLVFADSSKCRITQLQTRQAPQSGDLIANPIFPFYQASHPIVFIYGRFDLGQTGKPSSSDRDKIIGLVQRWGGKVANEINIDTDFVVMGAQPTVDVYTPEQLNDPFYVRQKGDQENAVKAYNDVLNKAAAMNIPIMNQNRFLSYCGYIEATTGPQTRPAN
jgi:hypothetical protein